MHFSSFPAYCGGLVLINWNISGIANTQACVRERIANPRMNVRGKHISAVLTTTQVNRIVGRKPLEKQKESFLKNFGMTHVAKHKNPNTGRICHYFMCEFEDLKKAVEA